VCILGGFIREEVFVGDGEGGGRRRGVPVPDIGSGGGKDGRVHRDRPVCGGMWG